MPTTRIVLSEWDVQELLNGNSLRLSGEVRPDEITLAKANLESLERIAEILALLIKQKKERECDTRKKRCARKFSTAVSPMAIFPS